MALQTGDTAPDFEQDTINGSLRFHEWMGRSWCILFSQPRESTTVGLGGATELAQMARLKPEWNRRGVKVMGLAIDSVEGEDGLGLDGWTLNFPVIADADRSVSSLYGIAGPDDTAAIMRRVYVIDPDKKVRLVRAFPAGTACDFVEMMSMVDCLQLADSLTDDGVVRNLERVS